jgi:RNA polymerase sigma factor (sigma-70 family)
MKVDETSAGGELDERGEYRSHHEADIVAEFRARHLDLVKLATLLLGDPGGAEDVVQDVFTRVWERRQRLATDGFSGAYFYRSVVNACRSAQRRRRVLLRSGTRLGEVAELAASASAEDVMLRTDEDRLVLRALAALPRRQREGL